MFLSSARTFGKKWQEDKGAEGAGMNIPPKAALGEKVIAAIGIRIDLTINRPLRRANEMGNGNEKNHSRKHARGQRRNEKGKMRLRACRIQSQTRNISEKHEQS